MPPATPYESIASPVGTIAEWNRDKLAAKIAEKAKELGSELIVMGLPVNMDGSQGERAQKCREFGRDYRGYHRLRGCIPRRAGYNRSGDRHSQRSQRQGQKAQGGDRHRCGNADFRGISRIQEKAQIAEKAVSRFALVMKEQIKGVNRDERDEAGQLNHRMEQNGR